MRLILFILLGFIPMLLVGQERVITVGLQYKPMLPPGFFNAEQSKVSTADIDFSIDQKFGWAGGMVIRWGLTRSLSLETGINYVKRNYTLNVDSINNAFNAQIDYDIIGYEIPLTGLVYIQLDRQWFMNASFGASIDLFPKSFYTDAAGGWQHITDRNGWIQAALLANLGFEYRTEKSGYFYLGGSFHRPFQDMYGVLVGEDDAAIETAKMTLNGTYLTIDLRYFFHEDPQKRKERKKKRER